MLALAAGVPASASGASHITNHHTQLSGGQREHVIPITAHDTFAGDIADGAMLVSGMLQRNSVGMLTL